MVKKAGYLIIFGIFVITFSKQAYAFLSPSTLQILINSSKGFIWPYVTLIFGIILAFLLKLNKKIIFTVSLILLVVIFTILMLNFYHTKSINRFDTDYFKTEEISKLLKQRPRLPETEDLSWDKYYKYIDKQIYLDVNTITEESISEFKYLVPLGEDINLGFFIKPIKSFIDPAHPLHLFEIIDLFKERNLAKYLQTKSNVSYEDKILFYCSSGITSRLAATLFYLNKYKNIKYVAIKDAKESSFIYNLALSHNLKEVYPKVIFNHAYYSKLDKTKNYLVFPLFDNDDLIKILQPYGIKVSVFQIGKNIFSFYDYHDKIFLCSSKISCAYTYSKLRSFNITEPNIYYVTSI